MHTKLHTQTRGKTRTRRHHKSLPAEWELARGYQRPVWTGHYLEDEYEGKVFINKDDILWVAPLGTPIPEGIEPM